MANVFSLHPISMDWLGDKNSSMATNTTFHDKHQRMSKSAEIVFPTQDFRSTIRGFCRLEKSQHTTKKEILEEMHISILWESGGVASCQYSRCKCPCVRRPLWIPQTLRYGWRSKFPRIRYAPKMSIAITSKVFVPMEHLVWVQFDLWHDQVSVSTKKSAGKCNTNGTFYCKVLWKITLLHIPTTMDGQYWVVDSVYNNTSTGSNFYRMDTTYDVSRNEFCESSGY
jgi:hypothetical protein